MPFVTTLLPVADPLSGEAVNANVPVAPVAVSVVMVSRGDPDRNRRKAAEHGVTFPVVLQEQWKLSREYAKFATPIAYLIDAEGRIAADVALGIDAILALPSTATAPVASGH